MRNGMLFERTAIAGTGCCMHNRNTRNDYVEHGIDCSLRAGTGFPGTDVA